MNSRRFNGTNREVSEIGLGTWQLGGSEWGDVSEDQALETLLAAAAEDVTFIDTADIYGLGRSETLIGRFLAEQVDPSRYFIATKLGRHPEPGWPDNFSYDTIKAHTEASLQRLGVDKLDLTQTHCIPHEVMQQGDVWEHLRKLKQQGLIRNFGASVETMDEAMTCLEVPGLSSLQIIFNVFRRKPIETIFEKAKAKNIAIIARCPLASGLLTGKMKKDTTFVETDHRNFNKDGDAFNVGETFAGLPYEKGVDLAAQVKGCVRDGMSTTQFALRWCLDFDAVTTVIPGAKRKQQAIDNARASGFPPLSDWAHETLRGFYEDEVKPHIRGPY